MAQLAVAGGGAAIGAVAGSVIPGVGTLLGAQIGWALGGVAGALLFPTKQPDVHGPRLSDLSIQTSGYGVPIPAVAGLMKLAGNVIWATEVEERKTTRRQGKGGGGQKTVTYSYYQSWCVGLCEWLIPPTNAQVLRIWMDTILVYDTTGSSDVTQIPGLVWRFHDGSETQLPDPLIEATLGSDAPAHRGIANLVFEDVPLDRFGNRMPQVTVEFSADAARTFPEVTSTAPASSIWSVPRMRYQKGGVAVDWARGRVYMGLYENGSALLDGIRVLDLVTLDTVAETFMADVVAPLGLGLDADRFLACMMTMGKDGYLYVSGLEQASAWSPRLLKLDPDTLRAVSFYGDGIFSGSGDGLTTYQEPWSRVHIQVPRLTGAPRNFCLTMSYVAAVPRIKLIDTDFMEFVWDGSVSIDPPVPSLYLIGGTGPEMAAVEGKRDPLEGTELWFLNASVSAAGGRLNLYRIAVSSGAGYLGGGATMGIKVDDAITIMASDIVAGSTYIILKGAEYDAGDDTLVVTVYVGAGSFTNRIVKIAADGTLVWISDAVQLPTGGGSDAPNPAYDRARMLGVNFGLPSFGLLALGDGGAVVNQSASISGGFAHWTYDGLSDAVIISQEPSNVPTIKRIAINRLASVDLTVGDVVEAIAARADMDTADLDVSALTDSLRGYVLARQMTARDAMTPLLAFAQADAVEHDDVLLFRKRGGAVVATIPYEDLVREDPAASVLQEQRAQDADLPREVSVRFLDIERGWEQNAQSWRRPSSPTPVMGGQAVSAMDLAIPLTVDEAKTVARRLCVATWRERTRLSLSVGPEYLRLVPTDPVNVVTRDGATIRCRVLSAQLGANWVTRLECVTEDAAAYGLAATGEGGAGWVAPAMPVPYYTRLVVPNLALVDDDDDLGQTALREYAFACAYDGARWRGVTLFRSPDYAAWSQVGVATVPVSWGMVDTAPAAPVTPWTWDDSASLVVSMLDGDVDSATALEVLNGANMAALVGLDGGAEIIQWRDAALGSDGRYTLTGLLRGRRGTEDQIATRSAGDVFILLDANRVQFAAPATEASATRILRAVGLYDTVETAAVTVVKAARGRAEQPYAVCQVAGSRDGSSNLTITWTRRTRVGGEWLDGTGTVPLSEASEAYEVDVLNGPPAVAKTYAADAGTAANAFDGNAATDWIVNSGTLPKTLSVTFAAAQVVSGYGVRARSASA